MDTQETGTSMEATVSGDASTEQTAETATSDTSSDGSQEDADTLKKRIADKDRYIKELEAKTKNARKEDSDDVTLWTVTHADELKAAGSEYQEELAFYKNNLKVPLTNDIRDRALREATNRMQAKRSQAGAESARQTATSNEVIGETRKSSSPKAIPTEAARAYKATTGKELTPERYAELQAKLKAEGKRA